MQIELFLKICFFLLYIIFLKKIINTCQKTVKKRYDFKLAHCQMHCQPLRNIGLPVCFNFILRNRAVKYIRKKTDWFECFISLTLQ